MKNLVVNNTSHGKKMVFNVLLSSELGDCKCKVDAGYEWKNPNQIMSFRVTDEHVIQLGINLNIGEKWLFHSNNHMSELSIRYRAYYISSYIRCIEAAMTGIPQSYFTGLVLLCAINSICNKRWEISFSSLIDKRPPVLRPIDIHCAIRALTKLVVDCNSMLSEDEKAECDAVRNNLLVYSLLPEIGYKRNRPVFSLMCEVKELQKNIDLGKGIPDIFPLFGKYDVNSLQDSSLDDFIKACSQIQHSFWDGVAMRLLLYAEGKFEIETGQANNLRDCIYRYREDSVKYFLELQKEANVLLTDNYAAVRRLSKRMNKVFPTVSAESGVLHYY